MVKKKAPAINDILGKVVTLSKEEALELQRLISDLLKCWEETDQNLDTNSSLIATNSKSKPRGTYIEWKQIPRNGKLYGPYPYLRYVDKGTYKSVYLKQMAQETARKRQQCTSVAT
jgi:hypothetical protein